MRLNLFINLKNAVHYRDEYLPAYVFFPKVLFISERESMCVWWGGEGKRERKREGEKLTPH